MGAGLLAAIKAAWLMLSGGGYVAGAWLFWRAIIHGRSAHLTQQGGMGRALGSVFGGALLIAGPSFFHGTTLQIYGTGGSDMFSAASSGGGAGSDIVVAVLGFLQLACGFAMLYGAWTLHLCGEQEGAGWKGLGLIVFGTLGVNYQLTIAAIASLFKTTNPLSYFGLA